jgi:hypothetical protein
MSSIRTPRRLTVNSKANIFSAGLTEVPQMDGGAGELPPHVKFVAGEGRVVSFARVEGEVLGVAAGGDYEPHSAEGASYSQNGSAGVNIRSYGGISGLKVEGRCMCLVGVFLPPGGGPPPEPAPERLIFDEAGQNASVIEPRLFQTFFIGDGRRSNPVELQEFIAPPESGRLYLGFACAYDCGGASAGGGEPGYYNDNGGALEVTLTIGSG